MIVYTGLAHITAQATSEPLAQLVNHAARLDGAIGKDVTLLIAPGAAAGGRLVLAPTASDLRGDADDVRLFGDAARKGVMRAKSAGAKAPLLVVLNASTDARFGCAVQVALLSALAGLYVGLQVRGCTLRQSVQWTGTHSSRRPARPRARRLLRSSIGSASPTPRCRTLSTSSYR